MRKYEMLFFDVDGTLIDNETHSVPESTIRTLRALKADGYKIAIATGRDISGLVETGLVKIADWDGFVCRNGASAYDAKGSCIFEMMMPADTVNQLQELSINKKIPLLFLGKERYMNMPADENARTSYAYFSMSIPPVMAFNPEGVAMVLAFGDQEYNYEEFKTIEGLEVIKGMCCYADILQKDSNKFVGVKELANYLHVPIEKTVAFGDNMNDKEMIAGCGLGICMGQGNEELKKIADYVTAPVGEDGIEKAIFKLEN